MLRAARVLLALASILLMGWRLGAGSLRDWDESLTAERAREMYVSRDFLTPRMAGEVDLNKPPLYYALTAVSFRFFGVTELGVRLWSVVFSLLAALVLERLGTRLGGSARAGLLAATLLMLNPHWLNRTREGLLDSGMLLGLLAGWWLLLSRDGGRGRPVLAGLAMGLSALVKNPLPLLAVPLALFCHGGDRPRPRDLSLAAATALIIGLPWYIGQFVAHRDAFVDVFLRYNIVGRTVAALDMQARPPVYYVTQLWKLAPATGVALAFATIAVFAKRPPRGPAPRVLLVAVLVLLGLMLMVSKRDSYLLLVYPFAALAAALVLDGVPGAAIRTATALVLVASSLATLPARYVPVLDYSAALKEASLALGRTSRPDATVLSTHLPVATTMFYSGRPVVFTWRQPFAEVLRRSGRQQSDPLVLLTRTRSAKADAVEMAAITGGREVSPLFTSREFTVLATSDARVKP